MNATPWPPPRRCSWCWPGSSSAPATRPNGPSRPASAWATTTRCAWDCRPWPWWPWPRVSSTGQSSIAQRAVTVAQRSDAAWANHFTAQLWLGTALADGDRLDEAEVVLQAGRSRAEQTGDLARLPLYHWAIAEARLAGGHWDDALAEAQAGLGLIEENASHVGDVFANALCAHVAFHRGDRDRRPSRRWTRPIAASSPARSRSASSG